MALPIGAVDCVFFPAPPTEGAVRGQALGFDHIDITQAPGGPDVFSFDGELALPVWDHCVARARTGCSVGVLPDTDGAWDRTIDVFRRHVPLRMEPWPGGVVNTIEKVHAMLDAVPGLGLLVDTGHVATWGEDPVELLARADHVQLRQASFGDAQRHADDGGDVDFAAVLRRLDEVGYDGRLSIEYFDFPDLGWPLDDPLGHAVALLAHVRGLQTAR